MAEVTINYKDAAIATMDASGTKTLQTQGKYCEDEIEVVYARPSGGGGVVYNNVALDTPITLGFINGTGSITVQTADKEITTDYLPISLFPSGYAGIVVLFTGYPTNFPSAWCAFSDFDNNQAWQRRTVISSISSAPLSIGVYPVPSGVSYIRASFRAKGGVAFAIMDGNDYNNFISTLSQMFIDGNFSEYIPT